MKEVNILLTSLSNQGDRKSHRYFYFQIDGTMRYCDGLSVAEAGAKYILSQVPIQQIIVLGAGRTYDEGEEMKPLVLKEWSDFKSDDTTNLSEYSFFQYRIAQYLDGLDLEAVDVLEDMDEKRKQELLDAFQKFADTELAELPNYRPDRFFHMLAQDPELFKKLSATIRFDQKELLWIKRALYTQLSDGMKLAPREDSEQLTITFIPTAKAQTTNYVPAQNVSQIVKVLNDIDADVLNVYMDMQGLASTEGYTILAVLSMLSQDHNNPITIREIITSHYDAIDFASPIDNSEMKRYDINLLISGMSAFVRYGKVDDVQAYWDSRGIKNEHIEYLLYAMRRVDEGISLCNIEDLEYGLNMLRDVFRNTPKEELPEVESNIFRILETSIRNDYGLLLEGDQLDELELVKWSFHKKFYQQCLTIIESRMPADFFKFGIFFYGNNEESKLRFLEEVNQLYWESHPKDRWNFSDLAHYFIKYYGRQQMDRKANTKDRQKDYTEFRITELTEGKTPLVKAYTRLGDRLDLLENVLYSYYRLGDIRNTINHALETKRDLGVVDIHAENENLALLVEGVNAFIVAYSAVREYLASLPQDSLEPVVEITQAELKEYTASHKLNPGGGNFGHSGGFRRNDRNFRNGDHRSAKDSDRAKEGDQKPAEKKEGEAAGAEGANTEKRSFNSSASSGYRRSSYHGSGGYRGNNYHSNNGGGNRRSYSGNYRNKEQSITVSRDGGGKHVRITIDIEG